MRGFTRDERVILVCGADAPIPDSARRSLGDGLLERGLCRVVAVDEDARWLGLTELGQIARRLVCSGLV